MKRKNTLLAGLIASALLATPLIADAAGLGKLKVISALGQPLRAEIELIAVPKDEIDLLTAKVASSDAYKQANIDRPEGLSGVRFAVERRGNGEPYLKISSAQPFNEPFLDLLIQLDWPTGRLLREYTILLDPPGFQDKPVAPAVSAPKVEAPKVVPQPAPASAPAQAEPAAVPAPAAKVEEKPVKAEAPAPAKAEKPAPVEKTEKAQKAKKAAKTITGPLVKAEPAPAPTPAEQTFPKFDGDREPPAVAPSVTTQAAPLVTEPKGADYTTKSGDNLAKIAGEFKPDGYSLERMMVALYENNKSAFAGDNMNRLKSGQILRMPSSQQLDAVSQSSAAKEVKAHASDWNAYRQKLAGAAAEQPAAKEEPKQEAAGKITAKAEDKAAKPEEAPKDVLKLSKGEAGAGGKGAAAKGAADKAAQEKLQAAQEEAAAKGKALKEANERVASLEKNVKDMEALLALKSKQLADLEKQAKAAPAPKPEPAKVEPPKPEAAKVEPPKVEAPKPESAPEKPAEPVVKAAPEPKPEAKPESKPEAKAKPRPKVKAEPIAEPSIVDTIMGNPLYLGGGAAALVGGLFAGLWALGRRRKKGLASFEDSIMTAGGELKTNTVFGNTAGGQIDTGDTSFLTDFSQAGMGAIDTNDVDPIAEAEVYMAYGRDAQAEEILKEALSKDASRHEVHLKLLEIYAGRKNNTAFETLAAELYAATSGQGAVWEKAAELGRGIDPANPLYAAPAGGGAATPAAVVAAAAVAATAEAASAAPAQDLDFSLDIDTQGGMPAAEAPAPAAAPDLSNVLDFNLDTATAAPEAAAPAATEMPMLDMDMDTIIPQAVEKVAETAPVVGVPEEATTLSFDVPELSLDALTEQTAAPSPAPVAPAPAEDLGLDFDFNLDIPTVTGTPEPAAPAVAEPLMPELDLSGIDLNLGSAAAPAPVAELALEEAPTVVGGENSVWEEASTKLDLARAYMEMGDKEGAREILQEVVAEGGPEQQADAKQLLASL